MKPIEFQLESKWYFTTKACRVSHLVVEPILGCMYKGQSLSNRIRKWVNHQAETQKYITSISSNHPFIRGSAWKKMVLKTFPQKWPGWSMQLILSSPPSLIHTVTVVTGPFLEAHRLPVVFQTSKTSHQKNTKTLGHRRCRKCWKWKQKNTQIITLHRLT